MTEGIAAVYRGPLEEFVRRRDELARELRSAGDREGATEVKRLRKPSRLAWALNLGAGSGTALSVLLRAVEATLAAQAGEGDVRASITALRSAVRRFAEQAAEAAAQSGHRIEAAVLANAVLAVLGRPVSFDELRAGRLTEIPEAGGLDFLASLPTPLPVAARPSEPAAMQDAREPEAEAEARQAARRAASALADAQRGSESAHRALMKAESKLDNAEARLRQAEEEARTAREERDRARAEVASASARLREAEAALAETERRLKAAAQKA